MPNPVPIRYSGDGFAAPINVYDGSGSVILTVTEAGAARLGKTGGTVGFYGTTPV
jgi:hypothetical protein